MSDSSSKSRAREPFTFLDLFCGCGGFTLGMLRAGFRCLAAVDSSHDAIETLKANLTAHGRSEELRPVEHALERDLTVLAPAGLAELLGVKHVDVIVGGPPCQGFSTARQRDGANHGARLVDDARRHLYREFLKYVAFFRPKVFVMENVLGIRTAAGGQYFARVQTEARMLGARGYRVHAQIEKAWELGVPQKRQRNLFIGTRLDLPGCFRPGLWPVPRAGAGTATLWDAIGDLPELSAGEGEECCEYDMKRRSCHLADRPAARAYIDDVLEVQKADMLTAHRARPHSSRDLGDFDKLREGESSAGAMRRGVIFDFPYDKTNFLDRYTRQHREKPCSTIVAHLSKDGLMFIHPTQNRSLTPREAARIQSFPDWFSFPLARTAQFPLIGNAVPPLVGEAVGLAVKAYIEQAMAKDLSMGAARAVRRSKTDAARSIVPLIGLSPRAIASVSRALFNHAWAAIAFLYGGLHPAGACEPGRTVVTSADVSRRLSRVDPRLVAPYYEESGWPVALVPIAREARRRYADGRMSEDEYYGWGAQAASSHHPNPRVASG